MPAGASRCPAPSRYAPARAAQVYVLQADQQLVKCAALPRSTAEAALFVARRAGLDDLVDQPELLRLHRRQELVALDRGLDHLERLPGMLDVDLVEPRPQPENLARLDLDVGGLALGAA